MLGNDGAVDFDEQLVADRAVLVNRSGQEPAKKSWLSPQIKTEISGFLVTRSIRSRSSWITGLLPMTRLKSDMLAGGMVPVGNGTGASMENIKQDNTAVWLCQQIIL